VSTPRPRLNLVVLRSPDIHHAVEFYRALGFAFTLHAHGSGPEHYRADLSGTVLEIDPLTAKSGPTTGVRVGFLVESVDRLLPTITALGVTIVSPPADSEWGRRAVVKDFDGHGGVAQPDSRRTLCVVAASALNPFVAAFPRYLSAVSNPFSKSGVVLAESSALLHPHAKFVPSILDRRLHGYRRGGRSHDGQTGFVFAAKGHGARRLGEYGAGANAV
jgi:hypothetical protein